MAPAPLLSLSLLCSLSLPPCPVLSLSLSLELKKLSLRNLFISFILWGLLSLKSIHTPWPLLWLVNGIRSLRLILLHTCRSFVWSIPTYTHMHLITHLCVCNAVIHQCIGPSLLNRTLSLENVTIAWVLLQGGQLDNVSIFYLLKCTMVWHGGNSIVHHGWDES
mgnify:CR=1 FL=1